jgi:2-polyprenyl-3-methyl-5-hydroxy-6-metoxy-1,4-benzoquinol methylase
MSIHRCQGCALRFARPVPSSVELDAFYQGFLYRKPSRKKLPGLLRARERELIASFALSQSPEGNAGKSFLDHGGGTGAAYAAARRLGLDSWFSDMDRQAIAHVSEEFGLEPSHVVGQLAEHPSRFDYVLSDNVVEHVPDPVALIRDLASTLKPGGVLVIKTPHAASTDMYFYPRVWSNYAKKVAQFNGWGRAAHMLLREPVWCCDPPRHLYSFTQASLAEMALQAGVEPDHFAVETYETPLLKNTYTERVLSPRRGLLGRLRRAALVPVLPAEWVTKAVQQWSRHAGWLSPGGLVLRVWRAGGVRGLT